MYTVPAMNIRAENRKIVIITAWFGLALFITAFLLISALVDTADAVTVRDLFYAVMGVTTVIALVSAAVKSHGQDKRIWTLVALAGSFWATGDLTLRICEVTGMLGAKRVLCFSDIFFFASYVALIAIVILLGRSNGNPEIKIKWVKFYPFGVVVFSILISVAFASFLPRGVAGGPGGLSSLNFSMIVNYVYTALDICIVAGLLIIILANRTHFSRLWQALLVLGLLTFSVADLSYSLFKPAGIYDPANLPTQVIVALWLTGYGLLSLAAIHKLTQPF